MLDSKLIKTKILIIVILNMLLGMWLRNLNTFSRCGLEVRLLIYLQDVKTSHTLRSPPSCILDPSFSTAPSVILTQMRALIPPKGLISCTQSIC